MPISPPAAAIIHALPARKPPPSFGGIAAGFGDALTPERSGTGPKPLGIAGFVPRREAGGGAYAGSIFPAATSWPMTTEIPSMSSRASPRRSEASFARRRFTSASTSGGMFASGAFVAIGGIGAVTCIPSSATLLSASNGRTPQSNS